jgi:hypothetical protein
MKKLYFILALFVSCTNQEYEKISQEVVDGRVSHTEIGTTGRSSTPPKIWVQTNTSTKEVIIPYAYDGRWKVGDSCLLIIEKYREAKK